MHSGHSGGFFTEASAGADRARQDFGAGVIVFHDYGDPEITSDVISGSVALVDRPNGGKLCVSLKRGDVLIAAKLDRLFRSAEDALTSARQLQERGVALTLADMGSDPVTGNGLGKLLFTMLADFAEFERWRIAERINDGRKGKRQKGGHIGGYAPYGFRAIGKGRDAKLELIAAEQRSIAEAKRWRAEPACCV